MADLPITFPDLPLFASFYVADEDAGTLAARVERLELAGGLAELERLRGDLRAQESVLKLARMARDAFGGLADVFKARREQPDG